MKLEVWNKTMPKLNKKQLLRIFEEEYINSGYLYSGCIPANSGLLRAYNHSDLAGELVEEGKLQIRDCEGYAFELPVSKRKELIKKHRLDLRWKKFDYCHPEFEIENVVKGGKNEN